ncbi:MAG: hypothetical protein K0U93_23775 [Gammaproteobacteria bacterium]|nr:hypothetical protein [Gammaproteobacteria bacterium]
MQIVLAALVILALAQQCQADSISPAENFRADVHTKILVAKGDALGLFRLDDGAVPNEYELRLWSSLDSSLFRITKSPRGGWRAWEYNEHRAFANDVYLLNRLCMGPSGWEALERGLLRIGVLDGGASFVPSYESRIVHGELLSLEVRTPRGYESTLFGESRPGKTSHVVLDVARLIAEAKKTMKVCPLEF